MYIQTYIHTYIYASCIQTYIHASRLTVVSREAKEEAASHTLMDSRPHSCINYCT